MGAAAIFSHSMNAAQSLIGTNNALPANQTASTGDASGTSSSGTSSATISANDFLTLLVTEMRNQDPTADTDPNQYINQLVSVNSLEQLIDINQNLSSALGNTGTSTGGTGTPTTADISSSSQSADSMASASGAANKSGMQPSVHGVLSAASHASGNLSVLEASAASQRVAHSLDCVTHAPSITAPFSANKSSL